MKEEKATRGQCNVDQASITFQKTFYASSLTLSVLSLPVICQMWYLIRDRSCRQSFKPKCYRVVKTKMVLSLTRSLASTQLRRTFTHQTWVSGISMWCLLKQSFSKMISSRPTKDQDSFCWEVCSWTSHLCWCVGRLGKRRTSYDLWLNFNLRFLPQGLCGFWLTSRITSTGIKYDHRRKVN